MTAEAVVGKQHFPADAYVTGGPGPRFRLGARVRTKDHGHGGHTRLPRYARGKPGVIQAYYGDQVLPDASAAGEERGEPLYCVMLKASDLWEEAADSADEVCLDLWESYLDPA